jgi:hypothetical protein
MLKVAFDLLLLREVPMEKFNFPFKHSLILITIIGALLGFADSSMLIFNPFVRLLIGVGAIWFVFYFGVKFMGVWLKRKGYWNGEGSLFNVLAAASLVDILSPIISIIGFPYAPIIALPLQIYSLIIAGNGIKGATNSGLGYAIVGLILWAIICIVIIVVIAMLIGALLAPLF